MSFEQHPEIFWGIVTIIAVAGGYVGASIRDTVKRSSKWARRKSS